jgi:hypothetical protein
VDAGGLVVDPCDGAKSLSAASLGTDRSTPSICSLRASPIT